MDIGRRIKNRREELGMSQDELAKKVGYTSRTTVNKIEKGANNLRQTKISEFAKALDCTPGYLMGWSNSTDSNVVVYKDIKNDEYNRALEYYAKYLNASLSTRQAIDLLLGDD